jgi:hypothetical protein
MVVTHHSGPQVASLNLTEIENTCTDVVVTDHTEEHHANRMPPRVSSAGRQK